MRTTGLYALAMLREFRFTLLFLAVAVVIGGLVYRLTPTDDGKQLPLVDALYGGWMAMLAQPLYTIPHRWWIAVMCGLYPVIGFVLVGEGVVRLALLMVSRRLGQKEWMRVMASTYRDHVVLCGLGHLGYRVLEQLVAAGVPVVVLEKHRHVKQFTHARELGVPVLIRDMKEDQALIDGGVAYARAIVICTNDDMANLEAALDARRLNPRIRVVMRLFDQAIAAKISDALSVDAAFSSSTLAAPAVAALALDARTLSTHVIAGVPHVAAEVHVAAGSELVGKRVGDVEVGYACRVLTRQCGGGEALESPPTPGTALAAGDLLVVHTRASQLASLAGAGTRNS
jgi:Trk K+ transport system NAD-binding subunit